MPYFFELWFYWKDTENKYVTYVDIKLDETDKEIEYGRIVNGAYKNWQWCWK